MKAPAFHYHRPASLEEALEILGSLDNARVLAGGQSLMPMLNLRVVYPDHLVDINKIAELSEVEERGTAIRIGAMARQRDLEESDLVRRRLPLMAEALTQIGHLATRNRGTLGGSLCHLDPAAELPVVAMALDATIHVASKTGARAIPFASFPAGLMAPAIAPGELVTHVAVEPWAHGHGWAFVEFARRHGDFAIVSAAALIERDALGAIARVALAMGGMAEAPVRLPLAEARLIGRRPAAAEFAAAAGADIATFTPLDDPFAPAWYRRHLGGVMAARALALAWQRSGGDA